MIYAFEEIDDTLDLVPLAARRALDRAGSKLSLEAWRALPLATRHSLVSLGGEGRVDTDLVRETLVHARAPIEAIEPPDEPSAEHVPPELADALGSNVTEETWRFLSPLDRFALAKVARKGASQKLVKALTEIVVVPEPRSVSSHLTRRGEAHMVDVGGKAQTMRRAIAQGRVRMEPETAARLRAGSAPKGDVLAAARIAGIQASKRTPELIPLCHAIALTRVVIDLRIEEAAVEIEATAEAFDRTGVEMEALVAASTAALTIYDMLKGLDRGMTIEVKLLEKTGGKSGTWKR